MSRPTHHFTLADYGVAAAMNVLWGLNIIATRFAVAATGPFMAGAVRFAALAVICLPWLRRVPGKTRLMLLLGMCSGGLFLLFMNLALRVATNVGALAIAGQLSVPIAVLMGVLFLHERISLARVAGLVLAFAGVAIIVFDPRIADEAPGMLLMIAAATCFATGSLLQRRLAGTPIMVIYGWTGLVGLAMLLPLGLALEPDAAVRTLHIGWTTAGWFAFSVIGSTLMGQGGMTWLLSRHPVSSVMPMTLMATPISVIASHLFLGTPITPLMLLGGAVTLVGVVMVTLLVPKPQVTAPA